MKKSIVYRRVYYGGGANTSWSDAIRYVGFIIIWFTIMFSFNWIVMGSFNRLQVVGYEQYVFVFLVLIESSIFIYYHVKYGNQHKDLSDRAHAFLGELPTKDRPAVVSLLIQASNLDSSDLTATLIDLVHRGYIKMSREQDDGLFNNQVVYKFRLIDEPPKNDLLNDYEIFLLNWFFDPGYSKNREITTTELRKYLKADTDSGNKFLNWCALVEAEFNKNNWINNEVVKTPIFTKILEVITLIFMFGSLGIILFWEGMDVKVPLIYLFLTYFTAIMVGTIYGFRLSKNTSTLTESGKSALQGWNAFVEYYKDNASVNNQELDKVALYDKYLVFAIALNVANKAIQNSADYYGNELYKFEEHVPNN